MTQQHACVTHNVLSAAKQGHGASLNAVLGHPRRKLAILSLLCSNNMTWAIDLDDVGNLKPVYNPYSNPFYTIQNPYRALYSNPYRNPYSNPYSNT